MASDLDSENSAKAISADSKPKARPKRARLWFQIHSLIGLNLSLLLGLVFLTGTLSVFSNEIDWLLKPHIRASGTVSADDLPWEAIAQSLAEHAPRATIDTIEAGSSPIFAPAAYLVRPDGGLRIIYFNRATGAVQSEGTMLSAKSLMRAIHSRLLLSEQLGTTLVSALSFFLMTSLIMAMLVYRKWWRGFFRIPRRNRGSRVFWGDLHRLMGVWCLVFGMLVALAGNWYFAEEVALPAPLFSSAIGTNGKVVNREAAILLPAALERARAAYPELRIRRIVWPGVDGADFGFYGQDGTLLVRPRANGITVGAFEATIVNQHSGSDASLHQRISEAADPVHTGSFASYWSKAIWFLFGIMMTMLAFSGATLFVKRITGSHSQSAADGTIVKHGWKWLRPGRGLGISLILCISAIGILLYQLPGALAVLR